MKKLRSHFLLCCAAVALSFVLINSVHAQLPVLYYIDPMEDGQGIKVFEYSNHTFQTLGDFNFQNTLHAAAFAGNAGPLTNLPSTAITVFTNTTPPASTNAPVGWFTITDTNGVSYRIALYR